MGIPEEMRAPSGSRARPVVSSTVFHRPVLIAQCLALLDVAPGQLVVDDWNNDDMMDLVVGRSGESPLLLVKIRGGPLSTTNAPADWPKGSVFAIGDLNNDLRNDLAVVTAGGIEIVFGVDEVEVLISGRLPPPVAVGL